MQSTILLLSPSVLSEDPRVLGHLHVAREFGNVVSIGYGPRPIGVQEHFEIPQTASYLPRSLAGALAILFRQFDRAAELTPFNRAVKSLSDGLRPDLVISNDVHSLAVACVIAKNCNAKIWADMHEYAPLEGEADWRWRLILKEYVTQVCRSSIPSVDYLSSVGPRICVEYEVMFGKQCRVIRNAAPYEPRRDVDTVHRASHGAKLRLVHVGVSIRARVLENMIEAVDGLNEVSLDLYLLPTDRSYHEELQVLVTRVPNVTIHEPVSNSEIVSTIRKYDCGIVTVPPTNFNYEYGLPNKFFQYLQARLPVVTGPLPEIAHLVSEHDLGWVARDFSVPEIKRVIETAKVDDMTKFRKNLDRAASRYSQQSENDVRREICQKLLAN